MLEGRNQKNGMSFGLSVAMAKSQDRLETSVVLSPMHSIFKFTTCLSNPI